MPTCSLPAPAPQPPFQAVLSQQLTRVQRSPDLLNQLPCLGDDVGPREADDACHLHGVPASPEKESHSLGGRWGSPQRVTRGGQQKDTEKGTSEAGQENHRGPELSAGDTPLPSSRCRAGRRGRPPRQQLPHHQPRWPCVLTSPLPLSPAPSCALSISQTPRSPSPLRENTSPRMPAASRQTPGPLPPNQVASGGLPLLPEDSTLALLSSPPSLPLESNKN